MSQPLAPIALRMMATLVRQLDKCAVTVQLGAWYVQTGGSSGAVG